MCYAFSKIKTEKTDFSIFCKEKKAKKYGFKVSTVETLQKTLAETFAKSKWLPKHVLHVFKGKYWKNTFFQSFKVEKT